MIPSVFDLGELMLSVIFVGLLALTGRLILDAVTAGLDAVTPPLIRKRRQVRKNAPVQLDVSDVLGPDGQTHFVVANARRWPRFRQRILLRIGGDLAPLVWVTAYSAPDGSKRFDYNLAAEQ